MTSLAQNVIHLAEAINKQRRKIFHVIKLFNECEESSCLLCERYRCLWKEIHAEMR